MVFEDSTPLPPADYTEMIMSAIEEGEDGGVDQKAISDYIESNYPDLPTTTAHSTILSSTLDKMCETGKLILADNKYSKPNTSNPIKRGRGRPPKNKTGPVPIKTGPTRSRGRPPMLRDPLAPPPQPKKSSGRPRGRPPTVDKSSSAGSSGATVPSVSAVSGVKRGRGRPPKNA